MEVPVSQPGLFHLAPLLLALMLMCVLGFFEKRSVANLPRKSRPICHCARFVWILALVMAMFDLRETYESQRRFIVVAVDQSDSIGPAAQSKADAFVESIVKNVSLDDRVTVLPFAAEPGELDGDSDELNLQATNLAAVVEKALLATPGGRLPAMVLVTDGLANQGDVGPTIDAAQSARVPISTLALDSADDPEVYVERVNAPSLARPGESFYVDVEVYSTVEQSGKVSLTTREFLLDEQETQVGPDGSTARLRCPALDDLPVTLVASIDGFRDTLTGNNRVSIVIQPAAARRVLLIENASGSSRPFVEAMEEGHLEVETLGSDASSLTAEELRGWDLLVLSNVPGESLAPEAMEAVDGHVAQGGALLVVGGDRSLTPGGYHETVIERVLPVWCESTRDASRPTLAMVLVIDRSASMREGGAIDLAKEAVRRAVDLLEPRDQLGVLAFDDSSRWVLPIGPCDDKPRMLAEIDTIAATGRTDMYPALEKAFLALEETFAERKHIMVLTDGVSHPGDFDAISERIAGGGITLSTVAVGQETAAGLLEHLAMLGGGHFYACDNPASLPRVFALETASVGGMGVWEKPSFARLAEGISELEGISLGDAPSLLGYVETTAKPTAQVLLASEAGDPLLASWRYEEGTATVFTSDAAGRWARTWLEWDGYSQFWNDVARLAMRPSAPSDRREFVGDYADELRVVQADRELLESIASQTGGRFNPAADDPFAPAERSIVDTMFCRGIYLAMAIIAMLLDVVSRRAAVATVARK